MSTTSTRTPFATTLRRAFAPYAATTAVEIRTAGWTRSVAPVAHRAPTATAARTGRAQDVPVAA
ncbi:hypothetical protein [Cellulomonas sp. PS-H5]|uniref:hypothetical protein n=1 Tax=Cellulomonas sp. PS-H5 TaxID=2820400 RepID=UPI001C4EB4E0|nr:hypothetical protein [Cellulomonas sp. PS-H5]MBW0253155.1 hypothetical protein [Cellulomonas sp. PS-H5]